MVDFPRFEAVRSMAKSLKVEDLKIFYSQILETLKADPELMKTAGIDISSKFISTMGKEAILENINSIIDSEKTDLSNDQFLEIIATLLNNNLSPDDSKYEVDKDGGQLTKDENPVAEVDAEGKLSVSKNVSGGEKGKISIEQFIKDMEKITGVTNSSGKFDLDLAVCKLLESLESTNNESAQQEVKGPITSFYDTKTKKHHATNIYNNGNPVFSRDPETQARLLKAYMEPVGKKPEKAGVNNPKPSDAIYSEEELKEMVATLAIMGKGLPESGYITEAGAIYRKNNGIREPFSIISIDKYNGIGISPDIKKSDLENLQICFAEDKSSPQFKALEKAIKDLETAKSKGHNPNPILISLGEELSKPTPLDS